MFTTATNSYNVTEQIMPFMRYQFAVVACNELGCGDFELVQPSTIIHTLPDSKHNRLVIDFLMHVFITLLKCSSNGTSKLFCNRC